MEGFWVYPLNVRSISTENDKMYLTIFVWIVGDIVRIRLIPYKSNKFALPLQPLAAPRGCDVRFDARGQPARPPVIFFFHLFNTGPARDVD